MSLSRGKSYRLVTHSYDHEESGGEEVPAIRWRNKPVGGGVSNAKGKRSLHKSGRRISCADLGVGTHQGWLRTRKPRKTKWDECHKWCVLKDADLYVYASKMDTAATSRIHLPLFKVSEAKETKKTGAFKLDNTGTTFYFRSKTNEEKYEWINHLSLAAIGYEVRSERPGVSTTSSSGIDSSYSTGTSQAYSDEDETDSSSICEETPEVLIRPKNKSSGMYSNTRLKSHIDVNRDLRRMVTSIRDADLDIVGGDRDTRRQSQMRRSLAQQGFSARKNSTRNKKIFILRALERQKQGKEQELADINAILANPNQSNLYDFLSHYPDYQDSVSADYYFDADQSSSARSSNDAEQVLNSIDSTCTVIPGSLVTSTSTVTDGSEEGLPSDRLTLTPDFDISRLAHPDLDALTLDGSSAGSCSSVRSSKEVFRKKKYKQTHTAL